MTPAVLLFLSAAAPALDLTRAVVLSPGLSAREEKAVQMLVEEVEKRTLVRWPRVSQWPADATPVVLVGPTDGVRRLVAGRDVRLPEGVGPGREGYRVGAGHGHVWVVGDDPRGVLFGVGRLLRALIMDRLRVTLPADFREESAPRTPLRGHQIGYRPKTNSYDGWTVSMWEQYLRDLIVFGCNAVELIPPRSDDDDDSPHFPLPPLRMMTEVSRLADAYGLDVWAWYPALDADYANPKTVASALTEWGDVFKALPRLDAVLVPGGDPGRTPPGVLLPFLEKQTANLRRYHPKAQMWVSAQGFDKAGLEEFLDLVKAEPAWLAGVVHGPQVRIDLLEFRRRVPARYPIRDYPDITHSRHCQYPVPDWDVAFALTLGREASNPRPLAMANIVRRSRPHTAGFITYSEGCHDDVNKCVWSALGWNERADVKEVLRQYAGYHVGPRFADRFAEGVLGLERNWQGPVVENEGIDRTLALFQTMEREAGPQEKLNWRFQQACFRAYYDAHLRARLRHEMLALDAAHAKLRTGDTRRAIADAEAILDRAATEPAAPALRARVHELAEALFQSVRAQLSVSKYHAIATERGACLDTLDRPLTEARWLRKQMAEVRTLSDESTRRARLDAILNRTDPGPGGFYDDLGDPRRQPHLVRGVGPDRDPAFYETPQVGFGFREPGLEADLPRAWWHHAEPLYDAPLVLRYADLDRDAAYRVRVVYDRERRAMKVRLTANDRHGVHGLLAKPWEPLEFELPRAVTAGGTLTLSWTGETGLGGAGRGCPVAEVWLMRRTGK